MAAQPDLVAYLSSKGIRTFPAAGAEVTSHCFMGCQDDSKGKGKLYLNTESWLWSCKKCDARGNRKTLFDHFGDVDRYEATYLPGTDPVLRRKALSDATTLGEEMLENNPDVLAYLTSRGLSMRTVVDARFGYVPSSWALAASLKATHTMADLRSAGLVDREGREFFSGHLLIPYFSHGHVVQIRGRSFPTRDPKYITPAGDNARLFNADSLQGAREALVIEGELDVLILQQHLRLSTDPRLRNMAVVGVAGSQTLPTGFAGYFAECRRVYVGFDPDAAGQAGSERAVQLLGNKARRIDLPADLPECDWTDYLTPHHPEKPHSGHTWRDVAGLIADADAAGRTLYTARDANQERVRINTHVGGTFLGIPGLDRYLGQGLKPGQIMIPIARTAAGKTAFVASITHNVRSRPTLIISLELTAAEYWERLIRIARFYDPLLTDDEAINLYPKLRIFDRRIKPGDVLRLGEEFTEDVGEAPQVVVMDYLGYASKAYPGGSQYERVTNTVMEAKEDAKAGSYVCIAPHQANRNAAGGAPVRMEDARDAGAIEDTADVMLGLFRPTEADAAVTFDGSVNCGVLKNRAGGRTGIIVPLTFSMASLVLLDKHDERARIVEDENRLVLTGSSYEKVLGHRRNGSSRQLQLVPDIVRRA